MRGIIAILVSAAHVATAVNSKMMTSRPRPTVQALNIFTQGAGKGQTTAQNVQWLHGNQVPSIGANDSCRHTRMCWEWVWSAEQKCSGHLASHAAQLDGSAARHAPDAEPVRDWQVPWWPLLASRSKLAASRMTWQYDLVVVSEFSHHYLSRMAPIRRIHHNRQATQR
jgi:hypothetical protein